MTRKFFAFIIVFIISFTSLCYADDNITITSIGTGYTLNAARIDARRNAAQKALGFIMQSSSRMNITNENVKLSEKIMLITRGITSGHEEELDVHEDKESNMFTVTLRVSIRGDELLRGLIHTESEKISADVSGLIAGALRHEQMKNETVSALTELLNSIPLGDYVRVKRSNAGHFDIKTGTLNLNLSLIFDREKYFNEAVPSIIAVLDYIADSRIIDVPFMLPSEYLDERTVIMNPSVNIQTLKEYRELMGIERGNRTIIDSGYANIYVQTRNYYFNAYRINHEAFIELVKNIFEERDKNFMNMKGEAKLNVSITDRNGMNVFTMSAEISDLHNIMYFMNTDDNALFQNMADNISDERQCALFIFPAFGFDNGPNHSYVLCQEDKCELPITGVSAENLIGGLLTSSVEFRRMTLLK